MINITTILNSLNVDEYMLLSHDPEAELTEETFNSIFKKVTGADSNGNAVLSSNPADFGVTWAQVAAKRDELEAQYTATQYQRDRQPEYPDLADLADALYWSNQGDNTKLDAYYAACAAVKAKYPKPEAS